MMEIREGLPDNAGLGKRRMKNGQRQVVNLQTLVFAEVPGQRAGSAAAGTVVPTASAGCGIVMAGAGKEEDLLMAGAKWRMSEPWHRRIMLAAVFYVFIYFIRIYYKTF